MQFAKDSFYIALRDRLAIVNAARTAVVGGVTRPAVLVAENELSTAATPLMNAFYLHWKGVKPADGRAGSDHLLELEVEIHYQTRGSEGINGADRGRAIAAMDTELMKICSPGVTNKMDHTRNPSADLGTAVLWTRPEIVAEGENGNEMTRRAKVRTFFYPEANL